MSCDINQASLQIAILLIVDILSVYCITVPQALYLRAKITLLQLSVTMPPSYDESEYNGASFATDSTSDGESDFSSRPRYHNYPRHSALDAHAMRRWQNSGFAHDGSGADGFVERMAARSTLPLMESSPASYDILSDTSSQYMLQSIPNSQPGTESSSNGPPSLVPDNGSGSIVSPFRHEDAEFVDYHYILNTYDVGPSAFGCLLGQVNCDMVCSDAEEWARHSRWHFGQDEPPRTIKCPFPCRRGRIFDCADGITTWQHLLEHVDAEHREGGPCDIRDDTLLSDYLWRRRIIDDMQYQQLQSGGLGNICISTQGRNDRRDKRESRPDRRR